MSIIFEELDGSPTINFSVEGPPSAKRRLLVSYSDWTDFVDSLLGSGGEFGVLRSTFPGYANMYVTSVECEPFNPVADHSPSFTDPQVDVNTYIGTEAKPGKMLLEVRYRTLQQDLSGTPFQGNDIELPDDVLLDYTVNSGGEFMTFESSDLAWETRWENPVKTPATKRVSVTTHELTFYNVFYPPYTAIALAKGKVNSTAWLGFKPETLLFEGATFRRSWAGSDPAGGSAWKWQMTYTFVERYVYEGGVFYGWNHTWCPETETSNGGWDRLRRFNGTSYEYTYGTTSFASLFQFAQGQGV